MFPKKSPFHVPKAAVQRSLLEKTKNNFFNQNSVSKQNQKELYSS